MKIPSLIIFARKGEELELDFKERTEIEFYAGEGIMVEPFPGEGAESGSNAQEDSVTGSKANLGSGAESKIVAMYTTRKGAIIVAREDKIKLYV